MSRYGSPEEPYGSARDDYGPPSDPWGHTAEAWSDAVTPPAGHPVPPAGHHPAPPAGYPMPLDGQPTPPPGYPPQRPAPPYQGTARPHPLSQAEPGPSSPAPPPAGPDPMVLPSAGRPPRSARSRLLGLYAMVAALVLVAAAGVGYALFLLTGDDEPDENLTVAPTTTPPATGDPTPATEPTPNPRDNLGMNAAMALVDDCLVNDGTMDDPQMRIVSCDTDESSQVFRVLAIFDEEVEGQGEVADEQAQQICADVDGYTHHYYEVGEAASFVLCLAELD